MPMHRRTFIAAAATALGVPALAEHQPSAYDESQPMYLEGEVMSIIWADPHPYLEILHRREPKLPADIRQRRIAPARTQLNLNGLLASTIVPAKRSTWRVDLPTMARLSRWELPRPKVGQVIGVLGFPGRPVADTPTVRAEILFLDSRGYPVRTDPA